MSFIDEKHGMRTILTAICCLSIICVITTPSTGEDVKVPAFTSREFIDHHNLRRFDYLSANGIDRQKLSSEVAEIKMNLDRAKEYGITTYILFSRTFDELVNYDFEIPGYGNIGEQLFPKDHPRRVEVEVFGKVLREVAEYAHSKGIRIIFHNNQFRFPDEIYTKFGTQMAGTARVCPGKEITWQLFRGKIAEFFDRYPEVDGLQITTSETQVKPLDCKCSDCIKMSPSDRLVKMVTEGWMACNPRGKEVQIRTWGVESDSDYDDMMSRLPKDVIVSTKHTQGDFRINRPPSDLLGKSADRQSVEFDLWGEYKGWNYFPCYMGDLLAERLRLCADRKVKRVAARVNWNPFENYMFKRPWGNEVNVYLYSKLAQDPYQDPDKLLREWIKLRYPAEAEQAAFELYKLSPKLQETWMMIFGDADANDHSRMYEYMGRPNLAVRIDGYMRSLDGRKLTLSDLRHRRKELDQSLDQAKQAIEKLSPYIRPSWREGLLNGAANEWYIAQGINDCLMMWSSVRHADPQDKLDLEALEKEMRTRNDEWQRYDPRNYDTLRGFANLLMLDEVKAGKTEEKK